MASNLEELYTKLKSAEGPPSLMKKNLTEELYQALKDTKTSCGGTLADCIKSGCENPDSGTGIYASDPEAYDKFWEVMMRVIKDYHKVSEIFHPPCDFGDVDNMGLDTIDPENKFIISSRIRVGRSLKSFGYPPTCTVEDVRAMEAKCKEALGSLDGQLQGTYYPLEGMTAETQKQLREDHFLFADNDRFLRAADGYKNWPIGRGIFHNPEKTFLVWVNEEDHLRIISMQMGGNLKEVYLRLIEGITKLSKLDFARHEKLGFLTFCPTNLGTALRASVHIKIPLLSKTPGFKKFCDDLNIQARGIHGEHTESVGGVYDISNKRRLGLTEAEAIMEMKNGVMAVIAEEMKLAGQQ